VNVRADAPYKSVKDLLAAVKANPGKFKASGTGQGGIWHLALAGLLKDQGLDPASVPWVPSNGAAPGLQDLVSGGVEIAPCSIPEARSLIDAGKVKSLAIMDAAPPGVVSHHADAQAGAGQRLDHGRVARHRRAQGLVDGRAAKLVTALKKVHDSKEFRDFMAARGYGVIWHGPAESVQFMAKSDADLGAVMKSVGIAK
jgi:tripartite-type tricarboxylate transporter receptor subunit TctC